MAEYTHGPWRVSTIGRRNDGSIAVMSEAGPVAYANLLTPTKRGTAHASTDVESEANARLIAAAPELLTALKGASFALAAVSDVPLLKSAINAAIAKAEGR